MCEQFFAVTIALALIVDQLRFSGRYRRDTIHAVHRRHRASSDAGAVEMICSRGHSAAFMPSIAAAPALMRGMSSLPNSVASFIGSKPRIRNEPIPSR